MKIKINKKLNIKVNKELKEYLYMLVGKELTYEDKEKILSYFNNLKQQNDRMKRKAAIMMTMLQLRIDKAIEYIEIVKDFNKEYEKEWAFDIFIPYLLDILKGDDKNGN